MARIRSQSAVAETSATTSIAAPTTEHVANDLLIVFPCHDNTTGGTWNTPAGWTLVNNTQSSSMSSAWLWKIAASSSETFPTMSTTATEEQGCYALAIEDVDTSDPINTSRVDTFSSGNTHTSTALTTDETKCLILYLQAGDGSRFPNIQPGFMALPEVYTAGAFQQRVAWTWQEAASAAPTITFHLGTSDGGHIHTVAINSSNSSPITPAYCDVNSPPSTIIHPLRGTAYTNGDWGGGNVDPTADLAAGIGPGSTPFNYDALGNQGAAGVDGLHAAMETDTPSSGSANEIWGAVWDLTIGNVDLSNKIACLHIGIESPVYFGAIDTVVNGGYIVGFRSDSTGTVGYRMWNVGASDASPSPLNQHAVVFEVGNSTRKYHDAGTFDITKVDGIFLACNKGSSVDMRVNYTECHILNDVVLLGGSSGDEATLQGFVDSLKASTIKTILNQGGSSSKQYYAMQGTQIGNGTGTVNFADPNASLQTAVPATGKNLQFNVDDDQTPVTIKTSANCTVDLSNMVFTGNGETPFTFDAACSSSATYTSTATTVIGRDVTLQDVFSAGGGVTWSGCKEIIHNGADRSGGDIFDSCTDAQVITLNGATQAALQTLLDNWANCEFNNNAVAIRFEYTGTGDIALVGPSSLTFSGNTTDLHFDSTNASTLTFTPGSGSNPTTTAISGSAVALTIDSSTAITLVAANLIDGTRYQIYNVTQAAELYNDVVSGGAGLSISTTIGTGLDIEVGDTLRLVTTYNSTTTFKRITEDSIVANVSSNAWTTTQEAWDEIEGHGLSSAGIDGVIFDDDTVNHTIDVLANWSFPQFAAWWGYIVTTELGIREWYNAITFIDSATARINNADVDLFLDNALATTRWQTTTGRIYRADGARPVLDPPTNGGLDPQWLLPVLTLSTGSVLTAGEKTELATAATKSTESVATTDEIAVRLDLNPAKPNTYSADGSVIRNDDFTLTKDGAGLVTKT